MVSEDVSLESEDPIEEESESVEPIIEPIIDSYYSRVKGDLLRALKMAGGKFRRTIVTRAENAR
jgi:hypothetical protein